MDDPLSARSLEAVFFNLTSFINDASLKIHFICTPGNITAACIIGMTRVFCFLVKLSRFKALWTFFSNRS